MGDQPLMQMAGEQGDAGGIRVVAEEMASHADLVAPTGVEHLRIQTGPVLDRTIAGGLQPGDVERHHGAFCGRPPLAGDWKSVVSARCLMRCPQCRELVDVGELVLAIGMPLALLLTAMHKSAALPALKNCQQTDYFPIVALLTFAPLMVEGINNTAESCI